MAILASALDPGKTYKLLQLPPDLEVGLRDGSLALKSSRDGSVYACTESSTHLVRVLKQTNTLLLARPHGAEMHAFANPFSMLETTRVAGHVDWAAVPVFDARKPLPPPATEFEVCCSAAEFAALCRERPAASVGGTLVQVAPATVHDVLVHLVASMVERGDDALLTPCNEVDVDLDVPAKIVAAVYAKFAGDEAAGLDVAKIAHYSGLHLLQAQPAGMPPAAFVKEWRLDMPVAMDTRVATLYGHVFERAGRLFYLDAATLPVDAKLRFQRLFALKAEWLLAEIEPLILPLVPATQKLDAWVLKYGRKKRVGGDIYLTPLRTKN